MKKFQYVTSLLATLGMCGVMGYAPEVWAQGVGGDKDESLPPLVMIVFDTSTSMHNLFGSGTASWGPGTGYNRLTRAVSEIAGAPKISSPSVISGSSVYLPRAFRACSDNVCKYDKKCVKLGGYISNLKTVKKSSSDCESYKESFYNDYYENGILHSYMYSVKFGFTGFASGSTYLYGRGEKKDDTGKDDSGWRFGVKIPDTYKTSYSYGIYTASPSAAAPAIYPTVSDESSDIYDSNKAVITSVRSYYANAGTPIGPALADLYYMYTTPDPGLIAQPIKNYEGTSTDFKGHKALIGTVDTKYDCRDKAVILITDGYPEVGVTGTGQKGQRNNVWEDARRLNDAGIKVYVIVYAYAAGGESNVDPKNTTIGIAMNKTAWQGGTCRNKNNDIIAPDDTTGYNNLLAESKIKDRICFYNASDSDALRSALVTALSDMLQGTVSKTSLATTTAIGQKHNFKDGKWNNGYYNVYSGYDVTMGPVRRTVLQRKAVTCSHNNDEDGRIAGMFANDPKQFIDLSKRLECRLRGKDDCGGLENTGYIGPMAEGGNDAPDACAVRGSGSDEPDPITGSRNSCLDKRYIFTAKYYNGYDNSRYAISTFDGNDKDILENVSILDVDTGYAGMLPKALNSSSEGTIGTANDANFLLRNNTASDGLTCADEMSRTIYEQVGMANYSLSPYECKEDFDCGETSAGIPRLCDIGRCIEPGDFASNQGCSTNSNAPSGKVCVGKYWRSINPISTEKCQNHSECLTKGKAQECKDGYCVCHAGYCLPGTVKSCDVRQFMASVPLGTIEYATPVPVEPPTKAYKSAAYRKFSTKYWRRDLMLMVGANDGMLHAFVLGDNNDAKDYRSSGTYDTREGLSDADKIKLPNHPGLNADNHEGDELWGFIPKMAYKDLYKLPNFGTQYFVNTKPAVADVQLPGITIDGDSWRTVLVGGFREGGRGYYAMDITNPAKPFVLWEIDHQWQPWASELKYPDIYDNPIVTITSATDNRKLLEQDKGFPFQLMGYSYSEPVIANLMIGDKVEPVAILAGGRSSSSDGLYDQVGKALYIVRLFPKSKEDLLVKTFYFDSMVTGSPALFPNNFNGVTQHIYVGDAKGALYRLDVSSKNINEWGSRLEGEKVTYSMINAKQYENSTSTSSFPFEHEVPIFNPSVMTDLENQTYQPITFKPAVSLLGYINSTYPTVQITYGTGSNDTFSVNNKERHYVATFVDVPDPTGIYQLNASSSPCFDPKIILFNSDLSKTGSLVNDNHLGQQQYRVYTKDPVSNASLELLQKMTGSPITHNYVSYFPTFVMNEQSNENCATGGANLWYIKGRKTCSEIKDYLKPNENVQNPISSDAFSGSSRFLGEGTKVYGLEITNQMYCIADEDGENHILAPQLIAQTGAETPVVHTDDGSAALNSGKVNIQSLAINLEAFKPEVSRVTWAGVYE